MYAQIEKKKDKEIGNKGKVITNSVAQKKGRGMQGFQFINNLSGLVMQTKLQEREGVAQFLTKSPENVCNGFVKNQGYVVQLARDNFTNLQKQNILARNKKRNGGYYRCEHCGFMHKLLHYATFKGKKIGDGGFQVDHIKAASTGGRALIGNGRVLCGTCNTSKGNRKKVGKSTGIVKYHALHGKRKAKDYSRRPIKRRKLNK